ncbi:MAG: NUDIX domain-containing protein [Myxococcota bacterium]|nr:NUDIX domain-containing protein [Myxococcota bacterium]
MRPLPKHIQNHPKLIHAYRPNVAAVIQRANGHVLWCERSKPPYSWQFPQGGMNEHESFEEALMRELHEELGIADPTKHFTIKQSLPETISYQFPVTVIERYLKRGIPSYIGQEQHWFLLHFSGTDQDINLSFEGEKSEFRRYVWDGPDMLRKVAHFKRKSYRKILKAFSVI